MGEALKEHAGRISDLAIGGIIATAVVLFIDWIQSPTIEDIRELISRESLWKQERIVIMNRFEGIDRTDSTHNASIQALWDENKLLRSYIDQELRARDQNIMSINSSMQRILIERELESKKKDESHTPYPPYPP